MWSMFLLLNLDTIKGNQYVEYQIEKLLKILHSRPLKQVWFQFILIYCKLLEHKLDFSIKSVKEIQKPSFEKGILFIVAVNTE